MAKVRIKRSLLIALTIAVAQIFIRSLDAYPTLESVTTNIPDFLYQIIKDAAATFFFSLIVLLGLAKYLKFILQ